MDINIFDLGDVENGMDTNGYSYLNHNINRDNYNDSVYINKVFYISECSNAYTYQEVYNLCHKKFTQPVNMAIILSKYKICEYCEKGDLITPYCGIPLNDFIHNFISDNIVKKFDTDCFGACVKTLISIYLEEL